MLNPFYDLNSPRSIPLCVNGYTQGKPSHPASFRNLIEKNTPSRNGTPDADGDTEPDGRQHLDPARPVSPVRRLQPLAQSLPQPLANLAELVAQEQQLRQLPDRR